MVLDREQHLDVFSGLPSAYQMEGYEEIGGVRVCGVSPVYDHHRFANVLAQFPDQKVRRIPKCVGWDRIIAGADEGGSDGQWVEARVALVHSQFCGYSNVFVSRFVNRMMISSASAVSECVVECKTNGCASSEPTLQCIIFHW